LAADLARRQVAVIFATGGNPPAFAAKAATATIPIVFITGSDPVEVGLVASLKTVQAHVTGVSLFTPLLVAKRLELLRELVPTATTIAFLVNPNNSNSNPDTRIAQLRLAASGGSWLFWAPVPKMTSTRPSQPWFNGGHTRFLSIPIRFS